MSEIPFSIEAVVAGVGTVGIQWGGGMPPNVAPPGYQGDGRGQVCPLRILSLSYTASAVGV